VLDSSNYFSVENNMKYMSCSQYKEFLDCEFRALAEVKGEYKREKTTALLIGSYVDSYFSGTLDLFKAENPEIFLKDKITLRSEYHHANYIIARIERDPYFMKFLQGEKQVIKTGEINGVPFKIKMDSYFPGKAIVDLKIMKDFAPVWKDGLKLSFVEFWKYDYQSAIYIHIEGNNLPFIITAATKEKEPDIEVFSVEQNRLDYCLGQVKENVPRFADIKKGLIEPVRCLQCDYCKSHKVLSKITVFDMIGVMNERQE
jgi:hypothetical protein